MRGGFRLGRVFGIEVTLDWSWGLVCLLMAWNLTVVFRGWHPTWTLVASAFLAIVATLLFFASVLAHELAHARVATSFGMKVRGIRLFLFGGVSDIEREPPSPRAEFWMAIVGPLMSFGLGILFLTVAAMTIPAVDVGSPWESVAGFTPLTTLFAWLGPVNLMVGLFNLIPAFPLDGGRVLRAALWKVTGSLHRATVIASSIGRATGWAFVLAGVAMVLGARVPFFGRGAGGGIWLAFIGWFLSSAAERSFRSLLVQEVLEGVRVQHMMRQTGPVVPAATTVRALVDDRFMRSSEHAYPIVDGSRLVGLVCVGDLRKAPQEYWGITPVTSVMTPRERLASMAPSDDAQAALRKLREADVDQLPVIDGDTLVGMLSRADVARWLEIHADSPPRLGTPRTA